MKAKNLLLINTAFFIAIIAVFGCQRDAEIKEKIKNGMTFSRVKEMFIKNKIVMNKANEAIDISGLEWKLFIVYPQKSKNALYILFTRLPKSNAEFRIHKIYWYKNWSEDSQKPIGLRNEKTKIVDSVFYSELK